ncbi:MAG: hypothetical protein QOF39_2898 [Frankiales bacterium]|nr:hypothetical protein [Frankiales bacterium]
MKKLGKTPDGGVWGYVGRQQGDRKKAATPELRRNRYRHARTGHDFVHTVIDDHSRVAYAEVRTTTREPSPWQVCSAAGNELDEGIG